MIHYSKIITCKYLLLFIVPVLFLFSCQKATNKPPLVLDPVDDYLPTTTGSTWTYGVGTILDTAYYNGPVITVTMSGDSVNKFGKNFAVANASSSSFDSSDKFYFYKSGGKYKTCISVIHDAGENRDFEIPILLTGNTNDRDTSFYIADADPSLPPAYKILSQAVKQYQTITVEGKTYKNCSEVQVYIDKRYSTDPTVQDNYYMYRFYNFVFAPNVGIIREYTNSQSMFLMNYDIRK